MPTVFILNFQQKIFEFEKNKLIIEEFIEEKVDRTKPELPFQNLNPGKKYAILFPGAGEIQKQWSVQGFGLVADTLRKEYNLEIKICGTSTDAVLADKIISFCKIAKPINLCGKTSLINLIDEISNAEFLFTNDSSALHIAACFNIKTVCVLNGRHYCRFAPYPKNIFSNAEFIYPDEMDKIVEDDIQSAISKTKHESLAGIDSINSYKVEEAVKRIMQ